MKEELSKSWCEGNLRRIGTSLTRRERVREEESEEVTLKRVLDGYLRPQGDPEAGIG